jgi:hypothetical protein
MAGLSPEVDIAVIGAGRPGSRRSARADFFSTGRADEIDLKAADAALASPWR